jgi:CRP/FNR family cyclic AMP-dependent transcriptional regulator
MSTKKKAAKATSTPIDPYVATLLEKISEGKQVLSLPKGEKIFAQGDGADAIFFIQSGKVKISVVSRRREGGRPCHPRSPQFLW